MLSEPRDFFLPSFYDRSSDNEEILNDWNRVDKDHIVAKTKFSPMVQMSSFHLRGAKPLSNVIHQPMWLHGLHESWEQV